MNNISGFVAGNIAYDLFDAGLSNILGLETLTHGTNLINYWGIRISGGNPHHGGKDSGSTKTWRDDKTQNRFYVFKDSEWSRRIAPEDLKLYMMGLLIIMKGVGRVCKLLMA